ncbi:MAG: TIGR04295 family B12-binding domain-containing radical SAM protein [Chloroflexota bacterium]
MAEPIDSVHTVALVNPPWDFEGSRYWACRDPHLPLELLYSEALLKEAGFAARVFDAHLEGLSLQAAAERVAAYRPDLIVVTTAPTYLFWRCCQPELDIPAAACRALGEIAPVVAVGPHGSATPRYALEELGCAALIRGEPEQELVRLAMGQPTAATVRAGQAGPGQVAVVDLEQLPALGYDGYPLELRTHRHHVFRGEGHGAELEFSRGCPYGCNFCNRRFFRGSYRQRPIERVLAEMRTLKSRGVDYVYFIDELFGLGRCDALLQAVADVPLLQFGCETRIDLWDEGRLDRLAAAGCVSVEFGLESPFPDVQSSLNKGYRIDGDRILELMVYAKSRIPWVQGDMMETPGADDQLRRRTEDWRQEAISRGVWVSEPIKLFLYPGCDLHDRLVGPVGEDAWIKARERS